MRGSILITPNMFTRSAIGRLSLLVLFLQLTAWGQQVTPREQAADDVVRVSTELIQTGVTVLDRKGKFVGDLGREDFELKVDSTRVPISFFELVNSTGRMPAAGRPVTKDTTAPIRASEGS